MKPADEIADILGRWRESAERGRYVDPHAVLESHPEHAEALADGFEMQGLVDQYFAEADALPFHTPERLGDYRIVREIGRGGMGVVYEAEQESMERRVALKVLYPTIATTVRTRKRFEREARLTGRLHHTNIVTVHAMGRQEGYFYFAMELVRGRPLDGLIEHLRAREHGDAASDSLEGAAAQLRGRGAHRRIAEMAAGVADALQVAHAQGVVHRDVKPSNLVLDEDEVLKLTDFGLAHLVGEDLGVTRTGEAIGTPRYMSPEQVRAKREEVDHRTDLYSLGATLYELLTLEPLHDGNDIGTLCSQILTDEPVPPRQVEPSIPRDLATIVEKALQKDRRDRYGSAADMARDLRAFAEGRSITARPIGPVVKTWRKVKRHRVRSALGLTVILLAVAVTILVRANERRQQEALERRYADLLASAESIHAESWVAAPTMGKSKWVLAEREEAHRLLTEAIELAPERPEAWAERANSGCAANEERLEDLEAARTRGLKEGHYWTLRGMLLANFGDTKGAQAALEKARGQGEVVELWFHLLGYQLARARKDTEAALEHVDLLLAQPDLPRGVQQSALLWRARARLQREDVPAAMEDLLHIESQGSLDQIRLRLHVALLWGRMGQAKRRDQILQRVFEAVGKAGSISDWKALLDAAAEVGPSSVHGRAAREAMAAHPDHLWFKHCYIVYLVQNTFGDEEAARFAKGPSRYERALTLIGEIREEHPDPQRLLLLEAMALGYTGRVAEGLRKTEEAIALGEPDRILLLHRAVFHARLGKREEAVRQLEALLEQYPDDHDIQGSLALNLLGHRDEDALRVVKRAVKSDPNCVKSRIAHCIILVNLRQYEEAVVAADAVLGLTPGHRQSLTNKGIALFRLGRYRESAASFSETLARDPDDVRTLFFQGTNMRLLGKTAEARHIVERLRVLAPMQGVHMGVDLEARLLADEGKYEEAVKVMRRAAERTTSARHRTDWIANECYYWTAAGRLEEAREVALRLLTQAESCGGVVYIRAAMLLGRKEAARRQLASHVWKTGRVRQDFEQLACAHALLGDTEKALEYLERAAKAGEAWPSYLPPDPDLANVWDHPRFVALRAEHDEVR